MAQKIQMKRFVVNGGVGTWVDLHPKTLAELVVKSADDNTPLVANGKIQNTFLPDYLLGQLVYGGTVTADGTATLSTNAKTKLGISNNTIELGGNTTGNYSESACEG